ncbi:MAG: hypothetical protein A2202_00060 [Bdellovibrionales bacterium RIFOXYA1_FULL_36_14]|nr:MAG: hypothetical protein A2202_00060 [Bdellovibrionales bacterium RIFOXYA1_FULL_36_14]
MQFFKFNLFIICAYWLSVTFVFANYTEQECLNKDFDLTISHKGQPFGLTQNIIRLNKLKCVIHIESEKLKFMKNKWIIDTCREPVHIKKDSGSVEIFKKNSVVCSEDEKKIDYCKEYFEIWNVIQDYGLIFAAGEKGNLEEDHGKVFCAYELVKKYLLNGVVFTRNSDEPSLSPVENNTEPQP